MPSQHIAVKQPFPFGLSAVVCRNTEVVQLRKCSKEMAV